MLGVKRTLFSLVMVLAFSVAAHSIQGALVKSGENPTIDKRSNSFKPDASAPRPWAKHTRDLSESRSLDSLESETFEPILPFEKRWQKLETRSSSKTRRRPKVAVANFRQEAALSNPRPWIQREEQESQI